MNKADITNEERNRYIMLLKNKYPHIQLESVEFFTDGRDLFFKAKNKKRILTKMGGTYIGHPDSWNTAKRAEFQDTIPNKVEDLFELL